MTSCVIAHTGTVTYCRSSVDKQVRIDTFLLGQNTPDNLVYDPISGRFRGRLVLLYKAEYVFALHEPLWIQTHRCCIA